jgi:predicted RND superfamily exporter protein
MHLPSHLDRGFTAWLRFVLGRPRTTLAAVALLALAAMVGLSRLELRMDGRAMVPPDDPAVLFDREVRELFGVRDPLVILLESRRPEGIYHPDFLRRLIGVSAAVRGLPGVPDEQIVSLATERRDRVYPNTLRFRPFLDPVPDTPVLLDRLREDVAAAGILLDGTLVSHDQTAATVLVGLPDVEEIGDRSPLYREVLRRVAPFAGDQVDIRVVGAPAAEALLGHHILEDMARLLPLSIASMAVLLFLRLRRVWGVLLGLVEVGSCLLATFGLMGWCGVPVSLTSGVLPLVLVSLCLADEIHLFTHYQNLLDREPGASKTEIITRNFQDLLPPVLVTALTTVFGFLSFLASPIAPIRQFGAFAALGVLYGLFFSLTVIPAALMLLSSEALRRRHEEKRSEDRLLRPFLAAARRPGLTLAATLVLAAGLSLGMKDLFVQDSWIEGFAPHSDFRRDTDRVNAHLLGTHNLLIHLKVAGDGTPPEGDGRQGWLLDPELLREIGRFEEHLRARPEVGGVLGPASHLSTISYLWHARKEGTRAIPEDPLQVARVYRFFDIVRGPHRRREVVDDGLDRALINVFLKNANYRETQRLIDDLMAWDGFRSHRVELAVAGDVAVSQAMIPAIVRSQVSSLLWALAGAFLTLVVLLRSVRGAAVAILPASLAVACVFGVMGWLQIPLGVATSMFCSISLGVGVDFAIHFVAARQRARAQGAENATESALRDAGPPILTDMAVVALSFAWMILSQVPSNARLGVLVALALGLACTFTLLGLPSAWNVDRANQLPDPNRSPGSPRATIRPRSRIRASWQSARTSSVACETYSMGTRSSSRTRRR